MTKPNLTMGPILFHWPAEQKLDFYARIADSDAIDTVYLGEVICSKRSPFFDKHTDKIAARLVSAGKQVVFSGLAEVMLKRERNMTEKFCEIADFEIEVNDASAFWHLSDRAYRVGPLMNVYNQATMAYLVQKGATHFGLPVELPGASIEVLATNATLLGVTTEVQVFGRAPLALSARCYHARAHGRIKDNCQFVCEQDPDGMAIDTLDGQKFLSINGIQTMSHTYLNLIGQIDDLRRMGVSHYRLSPHTQDMIAVAEVFRDVLTEKTDATDGLARLNTLNIPAAFSNGFWHKMPGVDWVDAAGAT